MRASSLVLLAIASAFASGCTPSSPTPPPPLGAPTTGPELTKLKNLKTLNLKSNPISKGEIEMARKLLPGVKIDAD